jgi:hypothetical protein
MLVMSMVGHGARFKQVFVSTAQLWTVGLCLIVTTTAHGRDTGHLKFVMSEVAVFTDILGCEL